MAQLFEGFRLQSIPLAVAMLLFLHRFVLWRSQRPRLLSNYRRRWRRGMADASGLPLLLWSLLANREAVAISESLDLSFGILLAASRIFIGALLALVLILLLDAAGRRLGRRHETRSPSAVSLVAVVTAIIDWVLVYSVTWRATTDFRLYLDHVR